MITITNNTELHNARAELMDLLISLAPEETILELKNAIDVYTDNRLTKFEARLNKFADDIEVLKSLM